MRFAMFSLIVASLAVVGFGTVVNSNVEEARDKLAQRECVSALGTCADASECCSGETISALDVCVCLKRCFFHNRWASVGTTIISLPISIVLVSVYVPSQLSGIFLLKNKLTIHSCVSPNYIKDERYKYGLGKQEPWLELGVRTFKQHPGLDFGCYNMEGTEKSQCQQATKLYILMGTN
ncbi:hypothetical protein J3A83DRAFT_4185029 [Scleroderma citrinum]